MNKKISLIVGFIVVAGICFYGGLKYASASKSSTQANLTPRAGSTFGSQFGEQRTSRGSGTNPNGVGGGFTTGQIISKDDKSITVSLVGGGSKIIFFDSSTKVSKSVEGTSADLTTGTMVSITGSVNTDGSMSAQSVQIRPATPSSK